MRAPNSDVAIIGGGLTGLAVARYLLVQECSVSIFEATHRLGGQIHTVRDSGFTVEIGAEAFTRTGEDLEELLSLLDLDGSVAPQQVTGSCVLTGRGLEPIATGEAARLLGIPIAGERLHRGLCRITGGNDLLITRLAEEVAALGGRLRRGEPVCGIKPAGSGFAIALENGREVYRGVAITAGPLRAADLLGSVSPEAQRHLATCRTRSSLSVNVAIGADSISLPEGASGFVVQHEELAGAGLVACSFASRKFPDTAPEGFELFRVFLDPGIWDGEPDARLGTMAHELLMRATGGRAALDRFWVSRWPDALVERSPEFEKCVRAARESLSNATGVVLAGAAYDGAGVPGCVSSARAAATALLNCNA